MVNCSDGGLELAVGGRMLRFPAVWLRDNCPCPDCVDPGSGQKLSDITDIPNGLVVSAAEDAGESVVVTYSPDRHRSSFTRSWLAAHALDSAAKPRIRRSRRRGSRTSRRYWAPWSGREGRDVRDSALTAVELCTLNATALPR